jgi:hypothetical protein
MENDLPAAECGPEEDDISIYAPHKQLHFFIVYHPIFYSYRTIAFAATFWHGKPWNTKTFPTNKLPLQHLKYYYGRR